MRNLYRGKTHQRIVQELSSNVRKPNPNLNPNPSPSPNSTPDLGKAGTKEATRSKAQARRDASLRYAKLVNELSGANPAEGIAGFDSASPAISRAGLAPGGAAGGPVDMKALGAAASTLNKQATHVSHRCPSAPAPQCPRERPSTSRHKCTGAPGRAPTHRPPTHPPSSPHTQVRDKEEQVQVMRGAGAPLTAPPSDELLDNHAQLSQLYVQAIRAKLDLFEGLAGS